MECNDYRYGHLRFHTKRYTILHSINFLVALLIPKTQVFSKPILSDDSVVLLSHIHFSQFQFFFVQMSIYPFLIQNHIIKVGPYPLVGSTAILPAY